MLTSCDDLPSKTGDFMICELAGVWQWGDWHCSGWYLDSLGEGHIRTLKTSKRCHSGLRQCLNCTTLNSILDISKAINTNAILFLIAYTSTIALSLKFLLLPSIKRFDLFQ